MFLNKLGKKQKEYLQEKLKKSVDIKTKDITLKTPDLPKIPANIALTPCPENMDSRIVVRSRFMQVKETKYVM